MRKRRRLLILAVHHPAIAAAVLVPWLRVRRRRRKALTLEDAAVFREDDQDPQEIFARYDAGPHGVTSPPGGPVTQIRWAREYINRTYGRRPVADLTVADLSSDQLAQYRGCDPVNDCYSECCQVACEDIAENADPGELRQAAAWAATQTWA